MNNHKLEILNYSYWEHFKYAKDLALILLLKHPKRVRLERELNDMIIQIHKENNMQDIIFE